jgi:hypothetical protein
VNTPYAEQALQPLIPARRAGHGCAFVATLWRHFGQRIRSEMLVGQLAGYGDAIASTPSRQLTVKFGRSLGDPEILPTLSAETTRTCVGGLATSGSRAMHRARIGSLCCVGPGSLDGHLPMGLLGHVWKKRDLFEINSLHGSAGTCWSLDGR